MYKKLFFFFFFIPHLLPAQILPKENSKLNYRLIGFSFPLVPEVKKYKIEIAAGNYTSADSFEKHIIKTEVCSSNKKIIEVPAFGKAYTWRVVFKGITANNDLHHFSTMSSPVADTSLTRLRILKKAKKYKDAYVFVDGNNTLYDMTGNPVWFTHIEGFDSNLSLRDLKLSPAGTITCLSGGRPVEINYNGTLLWKAPDNGVVSGDSAEHYHHEFTRFANGHYMILGSEAALCQLPDSTDTNMHILNFDRKKLESNPAAYKKIDLGTIIEYDKKGKVVWSWKSSQYFIGSDVENYRSPGTVDKYNIEVHENGFYFDEKNNAVYISFKFLNRIVKIKYPEGNVLHTYGEIYKPGVPEKGNALFSGQHSCLRSQSGLLIVYNNNSCNPGAVSEIVALQEPVSEKDSLKRIWVYKCAIEHSSDVMKYSWQVGGNIIELPDQSLLACMGGTYGEVFILGRDKKILWSALPEQWNKTENKWTPGGGGYRASIIIDRKAMEALIWGGGPLPAAPGER